MNDSENKILDNRLHAVWRRQQLLLLSSGVFTAIRWGLALFLACVLIDWLLNLPAFLRVALLLAVVGLTLFKAWKAGWNGLRRFQPVHTALQIERLNGGLHSLLVSAVQLRPEAEKDAMVRRVCAKAEEAANAIRPSETIGFGVLRRPALIAAGVLALLVVLSLTSGGYLTVGLSRLFTPWAAVGYPTRTQLELATGDLVVREGSPVSIVATVSNVVPRNAEISIRTGTGKPLVRALPIQDGRCEYAMDAAYRSFDFQISAGDARTAWHRVEVIHAPNIQKAEVTLHLPEYIQRPPETVDTLTMTVPETTNVQWKLTLDRPVGKALMNIDGQEPAEMKISADGLTVSHDHLAEESRAYSFSWVERDHGFSFTSLNNYLQVAPDRAPRVELTAPARNIYATLGRKVDFAFRGNDDHGIGEALICIRIDKTEESKIPFEPSAPVDGKEQSIDWDYREALPGLAVGQTVAFAIELADRYPGPDGPHRVRSESRWIQFMSREDYLAEVEKQKVRQLRELRSLYREQRKVHEQVLRLDTADPVFVQSCQLEAVRQDLMRERVRKLAAAMQDLIDDLAANQIDDYPGAEALDGLRKEVVRVAGEQLAATAPALRQLAGGTASDSALLASAKAKATDALDASARELGLLVLQLGYVEAAEVMAREYHAAAATQAALRLRTILQQEDAAGLAAAQAQLATWLNRLFAATPRERESTVEEAMTAFTLSRVVKQMIAGGMEDRLKQAEEMIGKRAGGDASRLQAEVIQALLRAEARLSVGAEREALVNARDIFQSIIDGQAEITTAMDALDDKAYQEQAPAFTTQQEALHRKLRLLLMPEIPARRVRIFEDTLPLPPAVQDLLVSTDEAMKRIVESIPRADRDAVRKDQELVGKSFNELIDIAKARVALITQSVRMERFRFVAEEMQSRLDRYSDRLIALLEETEDAADGGTRANSLPDRQASVADSLAAYIDELQALAQDGGSPALQPLALPACLGDVAKSVLEAVALTRNDKPGDAATHLNQALADLEVAKGLLMEHQGQLGRYGGIFNMVSGVELPSPFIAEIIDEQRYLLEAAAKAKDDDLPEFEIAQKNLVHTVDAALAALQSVSKKIESDVDLVFAKDDMRAAAEAMIAKDRVEMTDAQEFIIETMEALNVRVAGIVSEYRYVLEISEAGYVASNEAIRIIEAQRRLRRAALAKGEVAALASEQAAIKTAAQELGTSVRRITGLDVYENAVAAMTEVESILARQDLPAAAEKMEQAEAFLRGDMASLALAMNQMGLALGEVVNEERRPEAALMTRVQSLAARHKDFTRETSRADAAALKDAEARLREFAQALDPFIPIAQQHQDPAAVIAAAKSGEPLPPANLHLNLVAAKQALTQAAASAAKGDLEATNASQQNAADSLRHFFIDYAIKFLKEAGAGTPPPPPANNTVFSEMQDQFELFMPGSVSGERPPDGKAEWEVLGKRERAALNENFARELPLEHRETLKNYFEILTK